MTSDCSFRIGRDHAVCQDYGVARNGELTFVILADGCSSSPDTDVGARLLVRSAERLLPEWLAYEYPGLDGTFRAPGACGPKVGATRAFHYRVVMAARDHAAGLGIDPQCLDATLLTLVVGEAQWVAMLYGDGVLAVGERGPEGEPWIRGRSVSFSGGYPDYPSYLAEPARRQAFEQLRDNRRRADAWIRTPSGVSQDALQQGAFVEGCYVATGPVATVEWLAVLTDGAGSFSATDTCERTSGRVPEPEVLGQLLAFKSLSGVFVQRRVQRFLKECEARGWQHHDDLGVGAIAVGGG